MEPRQLESWTECATHGLDFIGAYSCCQSGNVGQEILNADGRIIVWTTDPWVGQVIVKLLNKNEGLLV
jgi:hypothetical protein